MGAREEGQRRKKVEAVPDRGASKNISNNIKLRFNKLHIKKN